MPRSLVILCLILPLTACLTRQSEPPTPFFARALDLTGKHGDRDADMLVVLASSMTKMGTASTLNDAVQMSDLAAGIYAKTNNLKGIVRARTTQADALLALGRTDEAASMLAAVDAIAQSEQCPQCRAMFLVTRARIEVARHDWDRANSDFDGAVAIAEGEPNLTRAAAVRLLQGSLALKAGEIPRARDAAEAAEALASRTTDAKLLGMVHSERAEIAVRDKDVGAAVEHLEKAQLAFHDAGASGERVAALCELVKIGYAKDRAKARSYLAEAEAAAGTEKDLGEQARQWLLIGDTYTRIRDRNGAATSYRNAETIYEDHDTPTGLAAVEVARAFAALGTNDYDEIESRVRTGRAFLAEKPKKSGKPTVKHVSVSIARWQIEASLDVAEGVLLLSRGAPEEALGRFDNAAKQAQRWNKQGLLGFALSLKADVHLRLLQFAEAESALTAAIEAYRRDGDEAGLSKAQATLVRVHLMKALQS